MHENKGLKCEKKKNFLLARHILCDKRNNILTIQILFLVKQAKKKMFFSL
jgi:hypothetical protein